MAVLQSRRLLELKAALPPGQDDTCLSNWAPDTFPCKGPVAKWDMNEGEGGDVVSITCSENGTVLELSISCALYGTLPASVGALPGLGGLKSLALFGDWGNVWGTLPPEWGSGPGLVGLEFLKVVFPWEETRFLAGPVPPEWGLGPGLANLKTLEIGPWPDSHPVPCSWGKLEGLESLRLHLLFGDDTRRGCLPSPQLARVVQLQIGSLEEDELAKAQGDLLAGVRGECWGVSTFPSEQADTCALPIRCL
jgi:hypothetical protein